MAQVWFQNILIPSEDRIDGLMDCQLRKSKVGTRRTLNRSVGNRGDGQDGLKEKYCWNKSVLNSKMKISWANIPI